MVQLYSRIRYPSVLVNSCLCVSESTGEEPAGIKASETQGTTHEAVVY